jgi:hypothetical protein
MVVLAHVTLLNFAIHIIAVRTIAVPEVLRD